MTNSNDPFISPPIKVHNRTIEERNAEIEGMELSEPEVKYALWIGKTNKWYKERHADYWDKKESFKSGKSTW
jgi:hypothetical protein